MEPFKYYELVDVNDSIWGCSNCLSSSIAAVCFRDKEKAMKAALIYLDYFTPTGYYGGENGKEYKYELDLVEQEDLRIQRIYSLWSREFVLTSEKKIIDG